MIQHDPAIHHDLPQSQHDLTIYYFPISRLFDLEKLFSLTVISLLVNPFPSLVAPVQLGSIATP